MKRFALGWLTAMLLLSAPVPAVAEISIGVHYEYPFGGMMADRPEWIPNALHGQQRPASAVSKRLDGEQEAQLIALGPAAGGLRELVAALAGATGGGLGDRRLAQQ